MNRKGQYNMFTMDAIVLVGIILICMISYQTYINKKYLYLNSHTENSLSADEIACFKLCDGDYYFKKGNDYKQPLCWCKVTLGQTGD